ncbi:claudin-11-like [Thalassophryne amazonica]|uniref:claudin-11-like n=1 Tax=Thalassophryne amazonica TaxID=390379 RepID=UPI001471790D|nr:claudin-11-like [Thalassophryne amazonica]
MARTCRQMSGSVASCAGWAGLIVATATNDWVRTCDYTMATCVRMDELGSRGLWAECVISPALYHCVALNQILTLPPHVQTSRALMISACLLGLPALLLVLLSMPCVRLCNDTSTVRQRRTLVGGILIIIMALCGIVSTVWFPIGSHQKDGLMSFGFSLYAGWVGSALSLLGGAMVLFGYCTNPATSNRENSFYYSRRGGTAVPLDPPTNHARSARV